LLLAFGRAQQEQSLTAGTSSSTGALLSQALSVEVSSRVQRLFGISRMRVDPNVGGLVATGGSRITVEQQVAPNLSITYIANTATSQQRIIQFDWDINDRTELIGERDQNGVFGLELRFRQRFK
jgi:translocation and assembly module TamB